MTTPEYGDNESTGMAPGHNERVNIHKAMGKIDNLRKFAHGGEITGSAGVTGIAHTCVAAHGELSKAGRYPAPCS